MFQIPHFFFVANDMTTYR